MKRHDLGWKIIKILNYDPVFAMPRLYHELYLVEQLAQTAGKKFLWRGDEMFQQYFSQRKTPVDRLLFHEIFSIELPESIAPALDLDYTTGVPNEVYRTAMAAEITEILTPWAREIVDVKIPLREITEEALKAVFNPGGYSYEPVLRYDLDYLFSQIRHLVRSGNYLTDSGCFSLPLDDLNPLPKIPVNSGLDREQLIDEIMDHPLTLEMLRDIWEIIAKS